MSREQDTPGVVAYNPTGPNAAAVTARAWQRAAAHRARPDDPPAFEDGLGHVTETPAPTTADVLAGHHDRLSALENMAHSHPPLTPDDWDGEE